MSRMSELDAADRLVAGENETNYVAIGARAKEIQAEQPMLSPMQAVRIATIEHHRRRVIDAPVPSIRDHRFLSWHDGRGHGGVEHHVGTIYVDMVSVAGAVWRHADSEYSIVASLAPIGMPTLTARNREVAEKWLHHLADLYDGVLKK